MPSRKTTPKKQPVASKVARDTPTPPVHHASGPPDVFVDFVFDHGLLHVAVVNGSDTAAWRVTVVFSPPFRGLGGTQDTSALPLFQGIEFLAPRRRIETFLDRSSDYFRRNEPRRITADLTWHDERKQRFTRCIVHDLGIYEDVSYVVPRTTSSDTQSPSTTSRSPTSHLGRDDHGRATG